MTAAPGPPLPGLATRVMKARRRSVCAACGGMVTPGQRIGLVGRRWLHAACCPAVRAARPVVTVPAGRLL